MRTARATVVGLGLVLALAPAEASAEPPRVSARLDYARGPGGEACPAEPTSLRAEVTRRMGYDPFARTDAPERLTVRVVGQDGGVRARVERFNAAGVSTWAETFPARPLHGECAALFSPLASYVFGLFLTSPGAPGAQAAVPPPEPAAPPVPPPALPHPPAAPPVPPDVPNVPNPARATARKVEIVAYTVGAVSFTAGVAFAVDEQIKLRAAQALSTQPNRVPTDFGCKSAGAPGDYCRNLLGTWQSRDTALNARNGLVAAAGVSIAVGLVATAWALNLPKMVKGQPQTQVRFSPGGLVASGTF
jgi:hypothetical protein